MVGSDSRQAVDLDSDFERLGGDERRVGLKVDVEREALAFFYLRRELDRFEGLKNVLYLKFG